MQSARPGLGASLLLLACWAQLALAVDPARPAALVAGTGDGGSGGGRPACPVSYKRMTLEEVAEGAQQPGGLKPYLFGGGRGSAQGAAAAQPLPEAAHPGGAGAQREWWGDLCFFKYSLFHVAPDGNRWATVAVCNEDAQRRLLRSWAARGYSLPLTLTPCDLWQRLAGRTLFLLGDSITQDLAIATFCFLFELREGPVLVEESVPFPLTHPVTPDPAAPAELPVPMRPGCAHLMGGGRVCFFRTDTGDGNTLALSWLLRHNLTRPDDIIATNFGLHHGNVQDYTRLVRDFAAFYQQHRAELPRRVFWQQTTALHYNTPTGEGGAGGSPFRCAPLKGISIQGSGELVLAPGAADPGRILEGGWRNAAADPLIRAAGIPVIQTFNETAMMWEDHRDNHDGQDCTHYCMPGAQQSAIASFYRALVEDEEEEEGRAASSQ